MTSGFWTYDQISPFPKILADPKYDNKKFDFLKDAIRNRKSTLFCDKNSLLHLIIISNTGYL